MKKKYILTDQVKNVRTRTLHRIQAIMDFADVKAGDFGGWVQTEMNLSQLGDCWIYGDSAVYGTARIFHNAKVMDNAVVFDNAKISGTAQVLNSAQVFGEACVANSAIITGSAIVFEEAIVRGYAIVSEKACVCGSAKIWDHAQVMGGAIVQGNAVIRDEAMVYEYAYIIGNVTLFSNAIVCGDTNTILESAIEIGKNAYIMSTRDYVTLKGFGSQYRKTTFYRAKDKDIYVTCGCFNGSLDEFRHKCIETHGSNKFSREYRMLASVIKYHFS